MQTKSQVSQNARHYSDVFLTSAVQAKTIDSNIKAILIARSPEGTNVSL